jgi:pyruvate dehydrogenase (quinone)
MSKKVAQVIIEALRDAGVEHCYGIVGDTLNAFASGLAPAGIKFIHMRHEEAGAFAAQGEALLLAAHSKLTGGTQGGLFGHIHTVFEIVGRCPPQRGSTLPCCDSSCA